MYLPIKLALESLVDLCLNEYLNPETLLKIVEKKICDIHHPFIITKYNFFLFVFKKIIFEF